MKADDDEASADDRRARLLNLLGTIKGDVDRLVNGFMASGELRSLGPREDAIEEAAAYLHQLGLTASAKRLLSSHGRFLKGLTDLFFTDKARNMSLEERGAFAKQFGGFPLPSEDPSEHARLQEIRTRAIVGEALQLGKFVERLTDQLAPKALGTDTDNGDTPDGKGFVKNPKDEKAYRPASVIISKHWPVPPLQDVRNKNKYLWNIMNAHPNIRRWRPVTGKYKLLVHLGDWQAYLDGELGKASDALKAVAAKGHWMCRKCRAVFVIAATQSQCPQCESKDITPVIPRPTK